MKRILYGSGTLRTSDDVADAVLAYAMALSRRSIADSIDIPIVLDDGRVTEAALLLTPLTPLVAISERPYSDRSRSGRSPSGSPVSEGPVSEGPVSESPRSDELDGSVAVTDITARLRRLSESSIDYGVYPHHVDEYGFGDFENI
ncbi:hypothetical protein [Compostimonas suwonensis]|uniref:Uncharacterized protein n=1 Tax=Compostimonas suwonensis TaxID=1048394 RepID=A0A2M9BVR3_9MICO|nr:hypothetical protein [Compostimonas suwonensis]PJJ62036.1 hypothetical protein CLV54_1828 [Compostimonas suwonensis]